MAEFIPKDQDARARISESLGETLFVEAGAGTGKTTSLVSRIMNLVETGAARMDGIAAITFTEAAAAELRERVRDELEKAAADPESDPARRERCRRGVEDLDQSHIGTLHGFASAMLSERPLEAGLPPAFDVMDPITADMEFEEVWREWIEDALDDELDIPTLPLALALGMTPANMRHIAVSFDDNHDLLEDADLRDYPRPKPGRFPTSSKTPRSWSACSNFRTWKTKTRCTTTSSACCPTFRAWRESKTAPRRWRTGG